MDRKTRTLNVGYQAKAVTFHVKHKNNKQKILSQND